MENNKENNKINNDEKLDDIIPGEILEKRKISKSENLSIKYNCIKTIKPYEEEIACILFLKTANIIITCSSEPNLEVWSFNLKEPDLNLITILKGHSMGVICLKEFSNLNCIASCSKDKTLKLWNIYKKICLKTFYYFAGTILTFSYNPKYNMEIYTAGSMGEITVWGGDGFPLNYSYIPKFKFLSCKKGVKMIEFIDDFDILVSCGKDEVIKFFDWNNNFACVEEINLGREILNFKYYKKRLVISCDDGNIHFVNMNVLRLEKSVQFGNISVLDFQVVNNEKYLLMGCSDGNIRLWEFGTKNRAVMKGHEKEVIGVGFIDLNYMYIISASKDLSIKIWKKEEIIK